MLDGVVVHYGSLPGGFIQFYNLGFTATHEVGHWLGLATLDPSRSAAGATAIASTTRPPMLEPTGGCPLGKDTCPEPGLDPIHNYMDYSDDACYTEFSPGQTARMQTQYSHWRLKRA